MNFVTRPQNAFLPNRGGGAEDPDLVRLEVQVTRAGTIGDTTTANLTALGREGVIKHVAVREDASLDDAELAKLRLFDFGYASDNECFFIEMVGLAGDAAELSAQFDQDIPYNVTAAGDLRLDFDILATRGSTTSAINVAIWAIVYN